MRCDSLRSWLVGDLAHPLGYLQVMPVIKAVMRKEMRVLCTICLDQDGDAFEGPWPNTQFASIHTTRLVVPDNGN
jgi:hypothetical protein